MMKRQDSRQKGHDQHMIQNQILQGAICVCGDWSIHKSSSGKYYFYNIKSEKSQWEKPSDWNKPISSEIEIKLHHPQKSHQSNAKIIQKPVTKSDYSSHNQREVTSTTSNNERRPFNRLDSHASDHFQEKHDMKTIKIAQTVHELQKVSKSNEESKAGTYYQHQKQNLNSDKINSGKRPRSEHSGFSTHSETVFSKKFKKSEHDSTSETSLSVSDLETSNSQSTPSSSNQQRKLTANLSILESPALTEFVDQSLTGHVRNWPSAQLEYKANRLSEEFHDIGNLFCSQVAADLKNARSLVRLAEIRSTLSAQRVMALREQYSEVEKSSCIGLKQFINIGDEPAIC